MKTKDQVLIESMFAYADHGINPCILTESVGHVSVLVESSEQAASLFSRLNDGRKELLKKIENIDWKEWVRKMKETIKKIIRFITAPARTAADLATGKTTLKEVGQRLKQVWSNLRNKKNKTKEEQVAESSVGEMVKEVEKAESLSNTKTIEIKSGGPEDTNSETDRNSEEYRGLLKELSQELTNESSVYKTIVGALTKIDHMILDAGGEELVTKKYKEFKNSDDILDLDSKHSTLYIKFGNGGVDNMLKFIDDVRSPVVNIRDKIADISTDVRSLNRSLNTTISIAKEMTHIEQYLSEITDRVRGWLKNN